MGSFIRIVAVAACAVVALSFALFAIDQSGESSREQVAKIGGGPATQNAVNTASPDTNSERVRERVHGQAREAIDDGNDILTAPFAGIVSTNSVWAQRLLSSALALLLYGFGGLLLANFFVGGSRESQDWREPRPSA